MATVKQQLQYLVDNKIAVISMEPWGTGARQFVKIGDKKAQYNGHRINNSLEKITKSKYIEEPKPMSSKNKKQAEIIQKAFKQRIKLVKGDYNKAFKGKVTSIRIKPKVLGSRIQNDLEYIIYNSYLKAKKDVPKGSEFNTYAQVSFDTTADNGAIEKNGLSTIAQPRKKEALVWAELRDGIFKTIQSNRAIDPKSLDFVFHFINVPSGGSGRATQSRDKQSILNKTSVNKVVNDDNNCFW